MNDRISSSPPEDEDAALEEEDRASTPDEETEAERPSRSEDDVSFWEFLKRTYGTTDPRSLGLLRIALGVLLVVDLVRRFPDVEAHYANTGWLTNHFMLFRPMSNHLFSLYLAASTPGEVKTFMVVHLIIYLLFLVGWRTRLMHVLSLVMLVSINSRNIAVENGGWVVLILVTTWSAFLPLGRRFSIDALLASLRARREGTAFALNDRSVPAPAVAPIVSFAVAALILQWATIYYFNVVHKTGPEWKNGTAVYYFFGQDRMVTLWGGWIRHFIPLWGYKAMTWGALAIESIVCVLLISPVAHKKARMIAWLLVCTLHLSIDSVVQLGPFSYAMMVMFFALIPSEVWEHASARVAARRPELEVEFNPKSTFSLQACRVLKRLDTLEHLHFVANREIKTLTVKHDGREVSGVEALREAARALPVPWFWRAMLRVPGVGGLLSRAFHKPKRASSYLGFERLSGRDELAPEPTKVATFAGRVGFGLKEAACVLVMICCASQVLVENRAVPKWLKPEKRPEWMEAIVVYPRLFQGWSMFAPSPPVDDGRLVVDGVTKDGRRWDPLNGGEPDFGLSPRGGFGMNQIWGDFERRAFEDRFKVYWNGIRDYLRNHHQLTGRPEDELVAFDVYWVSEWIPAPGTQQTKEPERRKLFSYGDVARATGQQKSTVPTPRSAGSAK